MISISHLFEDADTVVPVALRIGRFLSGRAADGSGGAVKKAVTNATAPESGMFKKAVNTRTQQADAAAKI